MRARRDRVAVIACRRPSRLQDGLAPGSGGRSGWRTNAAGSGLRSASGLPEGSRSESASSAEKSCPRVGKRRGRTLGGRSLRVLRWTVVHAGTTRSRARCSRCAGGEGAVRPARPAAHGGDGLRDGRRVSGGPNCAACCVPEIAGAFSAHASLTNRAGTIDGTSALAEDRVWGRSGRRPRPAPVAMGSSGSVSGDDRTCRGLHRGQAQFGATRVLGVDARRARRRHEVEVAAKGRRSANGQFADPSADPIDGRSGPTAGASARVGAGWTRLTDSS